MMAKPVYLRSPRLLLGVGSCFILMWTSERLPMQTMGYVWFGTIHESSVESVWRVDPILPYNVYINLNRRDSQI
jgi:hypothetical protein